MDSKEIIERWGVQRNGQLRLWEDYDQLVRVTPFRSIDPDFDREVLIHFWMHVYKGDVSVPDQEVDYEIWKTYHNSLYQMFKFVRPCGGIIRESGQSALQIVAYRLEPLEDHMKELAMWLPHYKPIANLNEQTSDSEESEGRKAQYLAIMERTLSERDDYSAWIYSPTDCEIGLTCYGRYSVIHKFDSLESMVDYIRRKHWCNEIYKW